MTAVASKAPSAAKTTSGATKAAGTRAGAAKTSNHHAKAAKPAAKAKAIAKAPAKSAKPATKSAPAKAAAAKAAKAPAAKAPAKSAKAPAAKAAAAKSAKAPAAKAPAKSAKAPAAKAAAAKSAKAPAAKAPAAKAPAAKAPSKPPAKAPSKAPAKPAKAPAKASKAPAAAHGLGLGRLRPPAPVKKSTEGYKKDEKFLAAQIAALGAERVTYLEQAESLRAEAEALVEEMEPGDIQFDDESGEGGTVVVDRERDLALSAQALAAVEEIDHALVKIKLGSYGICESCGRLIPKPRLEALPYARLCIDCKSGGLSRR